MFTINSVGTLSDSTLNTNEVTISDLFEFFYTVPYDELNFSGKRAIEKTLENENCTLDQIAEINFATCPDCNTRKVKFELYIHFCKDGDEYGGGMSIPVHLTESEYQEFMRKYIVPVLLNMTCA